MQLAMQRRLVKGIKFTRLSSTDFCSTVFYDVQGRVGGLGFLTFESVDEIMKCDHSNGSY